jgi:hypothetical protein
MASHKHPSEYSSLMGRMLASQSLPVYSIRTLLTNHYTAVLPPLALASAIANRTATTSPNPYPCLKTIKNSACCALPMIPNPICLCPPCPTVHLTKMAARLRPLPFVLLSRAHSPPRQKISSSSPPPTPCPRFFRTGRVDGGPVRRQFATPRLDDATSEAFSKHFLTAQGRLMSVHCKKKQANRGSRALR